MIKKLIASAALIAAGTALAGADETITVTPSVTGSDGGKYYGVTFTLDSGTYTNESGYTLDSLDVMIRYQYESYITTGYTVIYSYDDDLTNLTYVGSSSNSIVKGVSYNSGSYTRSNISADDFTDADGDAVVLYADVLYYIAFVTDIESAKTLTSFSSSVMLLEYLAAQTTASGLATTGSLIGSDGSVSSSSYGALVGATLTAVTSEVPEPSAFGLLAGVAALAFAASRRRRSRKAA